MITLKQLIDAQNRRSFLIPIAVLGIFLLLFHFFLNNLIVEQSRRVLLLEHSQNVHKHLETEAQKFNGQLLQVRQLAELLQRQHQEFFRSPPLADTPPAELFGLAASGAYIKHRDNGGASLLISRQHALNPETQQKAWQTEYWDDLLRYSVEQSPLVVATYFNSFDNLSRYYPFIKDIDQQLGPDIEQENFNFYTLANFANNPKRIVRWIPLYPDPAGQGWMVSAIVPIYRDDFLEGVTGLDLSIANITKQVEQLLLPHSGKAFLVDEQGTVLAMSQGAQRLLNLTSEVDEAINISRLPDSPFKKALSAMLASDERRRLTEHSGVTYLLSCTPIPETGWMLYSLTSSEQALVRINQLDEVAWQLDLIAMAMMLLFYTLYYYLVVNDSNKLARKINNDLQRLIAGDWNSPSSPIPLSEIAEVQQLTQAWQQLIARQASESDASVPTAAPTDSSQPTGVPRWHTGIKLLNRRELMSQGDELLQTSLKLTQPLSMIQYEVAEYSEVIEKHGRQTAEQLLSRCLHCTDKIIPEHALLAHLGGARFAILLPNTDKQQSILTSRRLRSELYLTVELGSQTTFSIQFAVTQAQQAPYESLQLMLERSQLLLEKCRGNRQNLILADEETFE